jgi:two-component sensor histidine kinase
MSESEMKVIENNMVKYADAVHADLEARIIALERALEALLKKEEMSKLNLSGGDGEWY